MGFGEEISPGSTLLDIIVHLLLTRAVLCTYDSISGILSNLTLSDIAQIVVTELAVIG